MSEVTNSIEQVKQQAVPVNKVPLKLNYMNFDAMIKNGTNSNVGIEILGSTSNASGNPQSNCLNLLNLLMCFLDFNSIPNRKPAARVISKSNSELGTKSAGPISQLVTKKYPSSSKLKL